MIAAAANIDRPLSLIDIPSKGRYYESGKASFMIRHLSYVEESILTNEALMNTEEGIKMVLRNLMVDDFDIEKLLPGDVQAISLLLYSTAYGDKIEMEVKCPGCSIKEKKDVLISKFQMKEIPTWPDENRKLEGVLPASKMPFRLRIPTFFEEFRHKKRMDNSESHLERLMFLMEKMGDYAPEELPEAIVRMNIRDSRFLRKFIDQNTPGVDTHVAHECSECQQEYTVHVSGGHNFLHLPASFAAS